MTTTSNISKKTGREFFTFKLSSEEMSNSEDMGFCVFCGEEAYGVEPDARKYECECCERRGVYGCEELILMGYITIEDSDETSCKE